MRNGVRTARTGAAFVLAAAFAAAGCDNAAIVQPSDGTLFVQARANVAVKSDLEQALHGTARFHSVRLAEKSGYVGGPCIFELGVGTMGFHYVNELLVDETFDASAPEALLYAPAPNGKLRLVGVEYIVLDVGQDPPTFDGYAFDEGGGPYEEDHWTLHAWIYEENPKGLHFPFNPNIQCPGDAGADRHGH
jgi:hypothetical protein